MIHSQAGNYKLSSLLRMSMLLLVLAVFTACAGQTQPVTALPQLQLVPVQEQMVTVRGGCFQMGDNAGAGNADEGPVHEVCLDDFYIDRYEVTQRAYEEVTGDNPSSNKATEIHPVDSITWNEADMYCRKIGSRLPTEAEWEYAAKSGTRNETWSGTSEESKLGEFAWHYDNADRKTHPVGQKLPNSFGLHDMSGNVYEWVKDWYGDNYYQGSHSENPQGPTVGKGRVLRGGSAMVDQKYNRTSHRYSSSQDYRNDQAGFRCARSRFPTAESGNIEKVQIRPYDDDRNAAIESELDGYVYKAAKDFVSAEILKAEKERLFDLLRPDYADLIGKYEVSEEGRNEAGDYIVKVAAAWVDTPLLKKKLAAAVYTDRVVLLTEESNLEVDARASTLSRRLKSKLQGMGYRVTEVSPDNRSRRSAMTGELDSLRDLGLYNLADLVVTGSAASEFSQKNGPIFSARASGQISVYSVGSDRELFSISQDAVKGFGPDSTKAGMDALKKVAGSLADDAMSRMPLPDRTSTIKLHIREVYGHNTLQKAKAALLSMPNLHEIQQESADYTEDEAVLTLIVSGSPGITADAINSLNVFVIRNVQEDEITVEVKRL